MNLLAQTVYVLCALTSLVCAGLMARGYYRSRTRILLWSLVCFAFLAINNVLLFLDKIVFPDVDLILLRDSTAVLAVATLVTGLVLDGD